MNDADSNIDGPDNPEGGSMSNTVVMKKAGDRIVAGLIQELRDAVKQHREREQDGNPRLLVVNPELLERAADQLEASEWYAKDGWGWLDKALKAGGWETVFDIPKPITDNGEEG